MQLLQFTVLLMHTSTTATLSQKSSFKHSGSHMHAIVSIISYSLHYPTGNYLIVQPKLPHSSTEEPLCSRDVVSRAEQGPERHNQSKQSYKQEYACFPAHIQALRPCRITSSTGTISLLISPAVMHSNTPPSSLALHTYSHTRPLRC